MPDTVPPDAEAILTRLLQAVPGGVVYVDAEGAVRRANPAATAFLGFAYDALTQRYTQDFAGDTWFENGEPCGVEHYPVTQALVTREAAGPTTIGVRQPDGAIRWAVFRAVPVEGGGAIVTFLDITERRLAERRLRISDRLASLGRLAAGVAHEINNPLTWVVLNLERALEEAAPREAIENALGGSHRVASIVRDLGAFARVDDAQPEPFDVAEAIAHAVAIARQEIQHRATLDVVIEGVPPAFGIASRTVQIVLNLLLNAAQAIAPGQRDANRIEVRASAEGGWVVVEVRDTGPGMSTDTLEHALDPFFTTKGPGEGTGLGLAISHSLATAMNGTLEIESQLGEGTAVRLKIPAAPGASVVDPLDDPSLHGVRPARLLVVDDEPEILAILEWALQPHALDLVGDGREALARLESDRYDAVICDLMMPEITGMELYARVVASHPGMAGRFLFMTGGAYTEEARRFVDRDDIRCISKPFRVAEVRGIVAGLLDE
ncbi:MAG: response regulator [Alphaproteobacteria bacterium]|nr:response regulator [Alphaproteobacteria bacterium]